MKLFVKKLKIRYRNKPKVFIIGANKTGTTTLKTTLNQMGYLIGNQVQGEKLFKAWEKRNFAPIIDYTKSAEAFQDIPFSLPFTYIFLEQHYPDAKFILSVRDSSEQWYDSLVKFQTNLWGNNGNPPTMEELKQVNYIYPEFVWDSFKHLYDPQFPNIYDKQTMIQFYENHCNQIRFYFKNMKGKLIEINVARKGDYKKLCHFLGLKSTQQSFVWKNKTIK